MNTGPKIDASPVAPAARELAANLVSGIQRLPTMAAEIRADVPGAPDRCERLAVQLDGLRRQVLLLGAALSS